MDNVRQIINKYRSRLTATYIAVFIIYLVCTYMLAWFAPTLVYLILIPLLIFVLRILSNRIWRKYISGILMDDIDAPLYREVIIAGKVGEKNPLLTMESEFFVGNVTAAMQVGNAILKNEKLAKKNAPLTLLLMAEYNFLIGDDESMALACKRFRELKLPKFKSKRMKRMCDAIEKYEQYLAGDYEAILRPSGKKRKDALYHLVHSYFEARAALCRGEKDSARAAFAGLAVAAEANVIGMMSKFAVEAIDGERDLSQSAPLLPNEPIDADSLMQSFEENHKKAKKRGMVCGIVAAVALLSLLPDAISAWHWTNEERITRRLVKEEYGKVEVLDWFDLDDEVIFIAESREGLLLGGRHRDENGDWQANVYGFCSMSELEAGGNYGHAFSRYNGEQLYFRFFGDIAGIYYEDQLYEMAIWTDALGFVYIVVNDEAIELIE